MTIAGVRCVCLIFAFAVPAMCVTPAAAQVPDVALPLDGADGRNLSLRLFEPRHRLVLRRTEISRARFPVVDVHTHFFYKMRHNDQALDDFVAMMDRNAIRVCVSLDGKLGDQFDSHIDFLWRRYRDRFVIFANVDW